MVLEDRGCGVTFAAEQLLQLRLGLQGLHQGLHIPLKKLPSWKHREKQMPGITPSSSQIRCYKKPALLARWDWTCKYLSGLNRHQKIEDRSTLASAAFPLIIIKLDAVFGR